MKEKIQFFSFNTLHIVKGLRHTHHNKSLTENLLCVRDYAQLFIEIFSFNYLNNPMKYIVLLHSTTN